MKPDVTPEVASNKNPMTRPLGKAIKTFRVGKRLTQKQLVDMIPYGVTQSYLSRIENGDSFPSNATVLSLVTALGCSTKELWAMAEAFASRESGSGQAEEDVFGCLSHDSFGHDRSKLDALKSLLSDNKIVNDYVDLLKKFVAGDRRAKKIVRSITEQLPTVPPEALSIIAYLLCDALDLACID